MAFTATADTLSLGMRFRCLLLALAISVGHWSLGDEAWARTWKPSTQDFAYEYLMIEHSLSDREQVVIVWMAPELVKDTEINRLFRKMVQEYMLIGVIHASLGDFGAWNMVNPVKVTVDIGNSESLTPLSQETLPPLVTTMIDLFKKILAGGLGKLGGGLKVFVFDGTRVDRCAKGVVWVNYLRERYKYQTPIPGCE